MPYVKKEIREELKVRRPETTGELNYLITKLINTYIKDKGLKYTSINDVIGALRCSELEFYRRIAGPYENKKIISNGDVYDIDSD